MGSFFRLSIISFMQAVVFPPAGCERRSFTVKVSSSDNCFAAISIAWFTTAESRQSDQKTMNFAEKTGTINQILSDPILPEKL